MTPLSWLRWGLRIFFALLLLVVAALGYFAVRVWWVAREDAHPRSDAIVVLGAAQFNGTPSAVFAARLDHARVLYAEQVAPRIVTVGGGRPGDAYTEAESAQSYLEKHGVPDAAILPLGEGSDTLQSMHVVRDAFARHGWHSAVLVTDPWHCLRARSMARDLGIKAETSPERGGPATASRGTEVRYIVRETLANLYYEVFGNDSVHSTGVV